MKKLFFASAAVLGVLSSCSSDDVANYPAVAGGEEGLVPVELALGNPNSVTVTKRGIGTVGDLADNTDANVWKGEDLWVLMMDKTDEATWGFSSFTYTNDASEEQTVQNYANEKVTAPKSAVQGVIRGAGPKYYDNLGHSHDFFAYHVDDAATMDGEKPELTDVTAEDGTTVTAKSVAFTIDGSQDLMAGIAEADPKETTETPLFSSKTARAGVKPNIVMKHLLSRFTFSVQAGDESGLGTTVKAIQLKSRTTGKMIVAYVPSVAGTYAFDEATMTVDPKITFTDGETATALTLTEKKENDKSQALAAYKLQKVEEDTDAGTPAVDDQTTPHALGDALLVEPGLEEYTLTLVFSQTLDDEDEETTDDAVATFTNEYPVKVEGGAKSGYSYNVNIKLYGLQKVELETTLTGWAKGNDIDIDTEEALFPTGTGEEEVEP